MLVAVAISGCGATTVAAPASVPKSYSALVLADAPAAYWQMDETTGTTMADATGNGNDGHYDGIVLLGQPGPLAADGSTGVGFDGATGGASVPSSTSLQTNWVTIELWINQRAHSDYGFYVVKNAVGGGAASSGWFELLILVGGLSHERFLPGRPLDQLVGRIFDLSGHEVSGRGGVRPLLVPLPHPSGASRWLNEEENRRLLDRALRRLRPIVGRLLDAQLVGA